MQQRLDRLNRTLGDILLSTSGVATHGDPTAQTEHDELHAGLNELQTALATLEAQDTNIGRQKDALRTADKAIRDARALVDHHALLLGRQICSCASSPETPVPIPGEEWAAATASWQLLTQLKDQYDLARPQPSSSIWSKTKAAATQAVIAGKILLQERQTNALLTAATKHAHQNHLPLLQDFPEIAAQLADTTAAYAALTKQEQRRQNSAALVDEITARLAAIQETQSTILVKQRRLDDLRLTVAKNYTATAKDGAQASLTDLLREIAETEDEIRADEEREPRTSFFDRIVKDCPECDAKTYELFDTKVVGKNQEIRRAYSYSGGLHASPPLLSNTPYEATQALYTIYIHQDLYRCTTCNHRGSEPPYNAKAYIA